MTGLPPELRARLEAGFAPVRPLHSPATRSLLVLPFAVLALFAAPVYFNIRSDAGQLGFTVSWGASLLQAGVGLLLIIAALRDSIPGREWSPRVVSGWLIGSASLIVAVTLLSWATSPILVDGGWWSVGLLCFAGSAATAMPVVATAGALAARAYPTRPLVTGMLFGSGAGLIADAGWRMFCHFTEPAHVLSAHLAVVIASAAAGSMLAVWLTRAD